MLLFAVLSLIFGLIGAYDQHYNDYHSIDVPIKSYDHGIKVIHAPSHVEDHTANVKIGPSQLPVYMTFMSKTSPIHVNQKHKKSKGSYKKSKSVDEPHKLVHEVIKPVYQKIKEIIKPYRKVVQVIEPVKEERLTKVHKHGDDDRQGYGGDNQGEETYSHQRMRGVFENMDIDSEYLQKS